ncbi:MAG: hypothetical protein ACUVSZ_17790, partial [Chloroflexus sp.]
ERVRGVMTGVLPSRELGARTSGAHGAGTIPGGRSQVQAPAPGGIHGRPGQMIDHNLYPIRKPGSHVCPPFSPLPTTGINHVRISGYNRYGCCCGQLTWWQCAAPAVPARAGWIAVPARYARVARCEVRQPRCRTSRAHDPARSIPFPILVTEVLDVLVPIIELVRHACDLCG